MAERLWTTHGFGLPEDFTLEGIVTVKSGRVDLDSGATFVDHGRYAEIVGGRDHNISITLLPQRRGVSLAVTRVIERVLDKAISFIEDKLWQRY